MTEDATFMKMALALAAQSRPSPNPRVGAVLVKNNKIIGKGWHEYAGGPHAEVNALKKAGNNSRGSTLYINLEPCSHYGRTPPCTKALTAARVKKVVAAMRDPNPLVHGEKELEKAGIKISFGLLEKEAFELNEAWAKYITKKTPFVTLKAGMTLDGKIATSTGESKWITSESSRDLARRMRSDYDAILVGIGTVIVDNPRLRAKQGKDPVRVILDSGLSIPLNAKVLSDNNVIIATTSKHDASKKAKLERKGVRVWPMGKNEVDVEKLLAKLAEHEVTSVLVEGGSETAWSFVKKGLVDKYVLFIAPKILAGRQAKGFIGGEGFALKHAPLLEFTGIKRIGSDLLVEARPAGK